jgi:hypothetical protein
VFDLLKVAKHGKGDKIYLIRFHYVAPRFERKSGTSTRRKVESTRKNLEGGVKC